MNSSTGRIGVLWIEMPTMGAVLMEIVQGNQQGWRMMMEIYQDIEFNQRGWYVNVHKVWLAPNLTTGKVWCDPEMILEDMPRDGMRVPMKDAAADRSLIPSVILHDRKIGFRIPCISDIKENAGFLMFPRPEEKAQSLNELCPWGLEKWILADGTPLRMEG